MILFLNNSFDECIFGKAINGDSRHAIINEIAAVRFSKKVAKVALHNKMIDNLEGHKIR